MMEVLYIVDLITILISLICIGANVKMLIGVNGDIKKIDKILDEVSG